MRKMYAHSNEKEFIDIIASFWVISCTQTDDHSGLGTAANHVNQTELYWYFCAFTDFYRSRSLETSVWEQPVTKFYYTWTFLKCLINRLNNDLKWIYVFSGHSVHNMHNNCITLLWQLWKYFFVTFTLNSTKHLQQWWQWWWWRWHLSDPMRTHKKQKQSVCVCIQIHPQ